MASQIRETPEERDRRNAASDRAEAELAAFAAKNAPSTTKHTCGGPSFGRLTSGCPRCDELSSGAKPRGGYREKKNSGGPSHFQSEQHLSGGCGPVCTNGDW